ncbi:hypothetical protein [uncultured Duncaniella sp.]|uniref:hypothetical protein n=1 Tax=uncultured Duncaniella sp. TaxID=2768039 RepID=UPI002637838B|nr:hypothetical protein [uncultured Duncaniella sp.]
MNETIPEMTTFCGNYANWSALKADYEDKIITPNDGDFYNILNDGGMIGEDHVHANDTVVYSKGQWYIVHNHPEIIEEAVVPQEMTEADQPTVIAGETEPLNEPNDK